MVYAKAITEKVENMGKVEEYCRECQKFISSYANAETYKKVRYRQICNDCKKTTVNPSGRIELKDINVDAYGYVILSDNSINRIAEAVCDRLSDRLQK